MSKSVLIIGGSGFFGQSLFSEFQKSNFFNLLACGDIIDPSYQGVIFEKLDILDSDNVLKTIAKYDVIINCAGQITNPINQCLRLNTKGIHNIVNALKGTNKKLIHVSTVVVYGSSEFADEESNLNPETPYSASKTFAEFLITSNLEVENYCIIRISNLYGNRQTKGIFNYLFKSFNSDKKLQFNNNGELMRYFLHVNDASTNMLEIVKQNVKGVYNLIGKDQYTVKKLVSLFEELKGCKFTARYEDIAPYDNCKIISDKKIEDRIHCIFNFGIKEYIERNGLS